MSDDTNNNPNPFDVGTIKNLVALMSRHDLSEIDLSMGDQRIRLRRGPRRRNAGHLRRPDSRRSPAGSYSNRFSRTAGEEKPGRTLLEIKSETPGTFYAKSKPDAPEPYVKVGSRVKPETVVCIIEAMKILNEITAGCTGVIAEILVENGQPVEFGQVLFRVDPAG